VLLCCCCLSWWGFSLHSFFAFHVQIGKGGCEVTVEGRVVGSPPAWPIVAFPASRFASVAIAMFVVADLLVRCVVCWWPGCAGHGFTGCGYRPGLLGIFTR
jgi:hypothetical protein